MVSFSCESCGDVLTKKKLDPHRNQCHGASFACLDCMVHFHGTEYRAHTSCISEAQKYQGALYRPEKEKKNKQNTQQAIVPHKAYVEDADAEDEYNYDTQIAAVDPLMPEAPTPPSAAPGFEPMSDPINVFDFLVDNTPNASRLELEAPEPMNLIKDVPEENTDRGLVRVRFEHNGESVTDLVEYGSGPVPTTAGYKTPAPKEERERERRREKKERDHHSKGEKKDKKRKRLHVDTHDLSPPEGDQVMTDAPPVLHSGLTGGLNRLMSRPSVFPPSPDYSGGDVADGSPASPLKKTKHSKRGRSRVNTIGNNLMAMITTRPSREHSSEERPKRKQRKHREPSEKRVQKMIEYHPMNGDDTQDNHDAQMTVYKPRAELLLDYITKGPNSDRGMSMHKALKRYHRDRNGEGVLSKSGKAEEEKELWRSLRMKRNDRGEIVLFL